MEELEQTLNDVAFELAETNVIKQTSEEIREDLKDLFFKMVNEEVQGSLATKTVQVPKGMDPSEYVARYHGDWDLDIVKGQSAVLIEKASAKPFSITVQSFDEEGNPVPVTDKNGKEALGFVVSRSLKAKTPQVDYDRLKEDQDLYFRVTDEPVAPPYVLEIAGWLRDRDGLDFDSIVSDWLEDHPQPRPIKEDADMADLAKLRKNYLIYPPSTAALNVRLAKEDEV